MSQRELLPAIALAIVFSPLVIGLAYWLWHVMRKRERAQARAALVASRRPQDGVDNLTLAEKIDKALAGVERHGGDRLPHISSIKQQLLWCQSYLSGSPPFPLPGPLSMGLLATRNLDMYGDDPELALLINEIEAEMNRLLAEGAADAG